MSPTQAVDTGAEAAAKPIIDEITAEDIAGWTPASPNWSNVYEQS